MNDCPQCVTNELYMRQLARRLEQQSCKQSDDKTGQWARYQDKIDGYRKQIDYLENRVKELEAKT